LPFIALFLKYPTSSALKFSAIILFILSVLVRAIDWNIIYYYGDHIDALFWENAFYSDGLKMLFTKVSSILALVSLVLISIFIYLLNSVESHYLLWLKSGRTIRDYFLKQYLSAFVILLGLSTLVIVLIVLPFFSGLSSNPVYTKRLPEKRFLGSIRDYLKEDRIETIILSKEEKLKFGELGLKIASVSDEYPLLKDSIFIDQSHRPRPITPKPNIIVVFFESLSSYFIEDPEIRKLNLTPYIDDFISQSLYFDRILNASTPTLQGLIAALSSSLHLYRSTLDVNKWADFDDVKEQFRDKNATNITTYPMISRLLKEKSYTSTHIQAGRGSFANTEIIFRKMGGYDQFHSTSGVEHDLSRKYPLGKWGAADMDTFEFTKQWLKKNRDNPFFLTISSIDIHHPYKSATKKDGIENNLLNCVYSSDAGFGVFWEYFKESPNYNNTIVILTADHPIFPTADYLQLRKQPPSYYDYIPLAIYSPFHPALMGTRNHTIGTSLDITPTIFELIGQDSKNAFLGLSLLSDRERYPHYLGRINLEKKFNTKPAKWSDNDQALFINYLKSLSLRDKLYKEH
jgi:hypothetical protein